LKNNDLAALLWIRWPASIGIGSRLRPESAAEITGIGKHPEKWDQEKWCEAHKGQVEVILPDGTRCDCVTDTHAIEFDFGVS
jgi:hypothetical protein